MRKVILFIVTTLDGYTEGPNQEFDWPNVDEQFNEFAIEQINSLDAIMFGRKTYELMAGYWPTPAAQADDPMIAGLMNTMPKVVFSQSLDKADWNNTTLLKGDIAGEIRKLKDQPGKNLAIFGSSDLAASLTKLGLIDEYRIMVNPVLLGSGRPLFEGMNERAKLRLLRTMTFSSGNVLLCYGPADKE